MKLNIKLNVSSSEFYNFLLDNLKRELNVKKIEKGMKFKKELSSKFSQKVESSVELINIEENKVYSLLYKTPLGENIVKYLIKDLGDYEIKVEYIEEYYTDSFWNKYNNMIVEFLMSYFLKKKKKRVLKQIEEYIKNNRKL
ncbi:MAG: DUF3284 domain-containing protein [Streptobacillus sp.]